MRTLMSWTKYYFYALVIVLDPSSDYRYFIKKGYTPFNSVSTLMCMMTTAFFCAMAYWSHYRASPPNDPGYVEWDHFRSEEDRFENQKDRDNWS